MVTLFDVITAAPPFQAGAVTHQPIAVYNLQRHTILRSVKAIILCGRKQLNTNRRETMLAPHQNVDVENEMMSEKPGSNAALCTDDERRRPLNTRVITDGIQAAAAVATGACY